MRALSVKQPWAELIARGRKRTIAQRTWSSDLRGELLIVASAARDDETCLDEGLEPDTLAYGHAVCVVNLWRSTAADDDYLWHVRSPRRVAPFKVKGYAWPFHVEDTLIRGGAAVMSSKG